MFTILNCEHIMYSTIAYHCFKNRSMHIVIMVYCLNVNDRSRYVIVFCVLMSLRLYLLRVLYHFVHCLLFIFPGTNHFSIKLSLE